MTAYRSLFILLSIFKSLQSEDCVLNLATREDAWDKVLHRDLRRHYHANEPPPSNGTCVAVSLVASFKTISLDEDNSVFTAVVGTHIQWRDARLAWSPAAYGGLEKMAFHSYQIWKPSLQVLNSVVDNFHDQFNDCIVQYNGNVTCTPDFTFKTFCSVNLRQWPYDMQRCALEFGDDQFGVAKWSIFFFPFQLGKRNDWTLLLVLRGDISPHHNMSRHRASEKIQVFIYRRGYGLAVIIVVPSVVIALLTLISSFMNPKGFVRLGVLCFSLLSHFVFLRAINAFLPKQSDYTPVILLFIRSSTIVTLISIVFTHSISALMKQARKPFGWISFIVTKVWDSFGKYLIFPRWAANLTPENVKNNEVWIILANVLNSIYVVILVITYVVLYHKYMPGLFKPNGWKIHT